MQHEFQVFSERTTSPRTSIGGILRDRRHSDIGGTLRDHRHSEDFDLRGRVTGLRLPCYTKRGFLLLLLQDWSLRPPLPSSPLAGNLSQTLILIMTSVIL